jgi:DNA invertase Pin-like site-specific DNA recombinase
MAKPELRRCAVYTRKSSEEGLEQDFNSLHAQREACEAFIRSQHGESWRLVATAYDDGGVSGGTMERPALQRLLADIACGKIDTVVVYKVDRLTRSLADFAKMVEVFDAHGVSFVAVTQQFNTTTSMGRLTLNILLSFAQFEREVTGERIRDKIAASKRKGLWMGGVTPLGYEVRERKLAPVAAEAKLVNLIYRRYLELGSVRQLKQDLDRCGIRSKRRVRGNGTSAGGKPFSRGALYALLANPTYIGEIAHKRARYPGQHPAIVDRATWEAVQQRLEEQGAGQLSRGRERVQSPLLGKLFDDNGARLSPTHATKNGRRYRYYISTPSMTSANNENGGWRVPAAQIEAIVAHEAARCLGDRATMALAFEQAGIAPDKLPVALTAADRHQRRLQSEAESAEALSHLIHRVELQPDSLRLSLALAPLFERHAPNPDPAALVITRDVPLQIKRRGVEMRLVIEDSQTPTSTVDPVLLREVARAHRCFDALLTGKVAALSELSTLEGIDERYVRRILPLAFLAPEIVDAIAKGAHPIELTAKRLIRKIQLPLEWQNQKRTLGFR